MRNLLRLEKRTKQADGWMPDCYIMLTLEAARVIITIYTSLSCHKVIISETAKTTVHAVCVQTAM